VHRTAERFGRIDGLINSAAITGPGGRLHEQNFAEFAEAVEINFLAPAYLCHQVIPHLLKSQGTVINLSGGGATAARPFFSAYGTAKCAIVRLTETLALEYPELRFYGISPGVLNTAMMKDIARLGEKVGAEVETAKRCMEKGGEDPGRAAQLARWLFENRPAHLSGRLISAIWDDYRNAPAYPPKLGWWTLRRVDEVCRKNLKETE
jgi:NAD(P)-dependent dehydrogenase (short-subunit alcohol dehydrogenase family)